MAKILGIGITTLNKIEQGVLPPRLSAEILFRIREYFGGFFKFVSKHRIRRDNSLKENLYRRILSYQKYDGFNV